MIESIHKKNPSIKIDFLLRKGNESLLTDHPYINEVIIWDKSTQKFKNLRGLARDLKHSRHDAVINLQRFGSTGFLTWKSSAKIKVGYRKNPFSFSFTHRVDHEFGTGIHEIERNYKLLQKVGDFPFEKPKLYPSEEAKQKAQSIKTDNKLIVMAPSSVWFTKQLPKEKWLDLIRQYTENEKIVLIGAKNDYAYLEEIKKDCGHLNVINLSGELNLLESAALMQIADRNHVNDSAPLHLASAMNAPVTAYFCSTVPSFGFGPLSDESEIKEVSEKLPCRPCGMHGFKSCPKGHFKCGHDIDVTLSA